LDVLLQITAALVATPFSVIAAGGMVVIEYLTAQYAGGIGEVICKFYPKTIFYRVYLNNCVCDGLERQNILLKRLWSAFEWWTKLL